MYNYILSWNIFIHVYIPLISKFLDLDISLNLINIDFLPALPLVIYYKFKYCALIYRCLQQLIEEEQSSS